MRKEELVGVDDRAPRATDAPGLGERAAGETAEDVEEHVVREAYAVAVGPVHLAGGLARAVGLAEGADRWRATKARAIDEVA